MDGYWGEAKEAAMADIAVAAATPRRFGKGPWKSFRRYKRRPGYSKRFGDRLSWKKQLNEHRFKRSYELDLWLAGQAKGYHFKIGDVPNAAEFTALYDQFRLDWVVIWAFPAQNVAQVQAVATYIPTLFSFVDKDDSTAPGTLDDVLERGNKVNHLMDQGKKVASFRPHLDAEVYKSALTTSYSSKGGQWITDVDIPHYGWKAWVEPALSGNNSIRLVADLYFTCKGTS